MSVTSKQYNIRQLNVINSSERNILCLAAAASGKTAVTTARIKKLLNDGVKPYRIVAFTFTNQAAEEMKKRIGEDCKGMFIGTIHSYANRICIENGIDTSDYIAAENFDKIIEKALVVNQSNYPIIDYLFVDEFQDTDPNQYKFIEKIPTYGRFYCGDERQFIYGFRGCTDKFIRDIANNPAFKVYNLTANYRNPPNILKFADGFLGSMKKISLNSVAAKIEDGVLEDDSTFLDALEILKENKNWADWAVLCRTNNEIDAVQEILNKEKIPNVVIRRGDLNLEMLGELLKSNRVKIATTHAYKGLQIPHVIAVGMKVFNGEERRISYVAATRAEQSLYWCPTVKTKKKEKKTISNTSVFDKTSMQSITF